MRARYWKDGNGINILENLETNMGANDIAVEGRDVFITGYIVEGGYSRAKCWKNGNEMPLREVGVSSSMATAIAVVKK